MKVSSECVPCLMRQVLSTARIAGRDEDARRAMMIEGLKAMACLDLDRSPGEVCFDMLTPVYAMLGDSDPYREVKARQNKLAMSCLEALEDRVDAADDPMLFALKLAAAGNVVDSGIRGGFDLDATLNRVLERPFAVNDYDKFREKLAAANSVMYIVDNAGEIVFDRLVLERLSGVELTCVVRYSPMLNDAMLEDAQMLGLDRIARIIDPGIGTLGIPLDKCSREFIAEFERADMIVCKGQANFETLEEYSGDKRVKDKLFFVLMSKCDCVSEILGVETGDAVLKLA